MEDEHYLKTVRDSLAEGRTVLDVFSADGANAAAVASMARIIAKCFRTGNKVLACGNGGSACDATHFAEEFTGRYRKDRRALPAIALVDGAYLSCVANDYGFDEVFARGVSAYGQAGDVLLAISTSGNSRNVIRAVEEAGKRGMAVLLLLGRDGGSLRGRGDTEIVVAGDNSDRIQEVHMLALHILVECVERDLFPENYR
jgi:D-sedoheptulose 7-phosphate isomerase